MSRISIGVLQPGARPVGIGVMGARRGVAMFGGAPQAVIVKSCTAPELAAECFCALLADALSVQAPPCGLVFENGVPLFGSIDVGVPNLMQQFCIDTTNPSSHELRVLVDELVQWVGFGRLIALDILVRNADRHPGNLLTDGADYWAIDHGRCLDLHPYQAHKAYRLAAQFADPLVCANIEAGAVSHALTFPMGCEASASSELAAYPVIAGYAKPFAAQVASRLPALASSIKGLL
ncbi:MAG: hypothetical protein ACK6DW_03655 [Betaproteobacteria bacterium]